MTCGYFPKFMKKLGNGNTDFTEWGSQKGTYFLRVENKAYFQMHVPPSLSSDSCMGHAQYSISMCFRFPSAIPSQGAALIGVGGLVVRATQTGIVHLQGLSSANSMPRRKCLVQGEWSAVTVAVDCANQHAALWVDGNLIQEEHDLQGLYEIQDAADSKEFSESKDREYTEIQGATVHVLGCKVASCSKAVSGIQSARTDLRMVQIDTSFLSLSDVLGIHVPLGVWTCACGMRNGEAFSTCQSESCGAKKKKSAPRPKGDADPNKPGLTVVVNESFKEIVLNKDKHVFLYLSTDFASLRNQVDPEWTKLANLLKDCADIVVAKMDGDKNERDRYYMPEHFFPVIKLFPKGDKSNSVLYPGPGQCLCMEFVKFLEQYTQFDFAAYKAEQLPAYLETKEVSTIIQKAQSSLAYALNEATISSCWLIRGQAALHEPSDLVAYLVRRFLAQYFLDTDAFPEDHESLARINDGEWAGSQISLESVQRMMAEVKRQVELCLSMALPEQPLAYLPEGLMGLEVIFGPSARLETAWDQTILEQIAQFVSTRAKPSTRLLDDMFKKAKQACRNGDLATLDKLLKQGMPTRAEQGESLVCWAAAEGHVQLLELLFVYGGNLADHMSTPRQGLLSPLEIASWLGHSKVCQYLLDNGACLGSALLKAVGGGHSLIVHKLLEAGANPDVRINGRSAVHVAVLAQRDEILGDLLSHGAQLQRPLGEELCTELEIAYGSSVLHAAAKLSLVHSIEEILKRWKESAEQENDAKQTPFELADISIKPLIKPTYLHTLRLLRSCVIGGKASEKNEHGHSKAYQELKEMFERNKGEADANAQDVRGWTALMAAAVANDANSCRLLIEHKARWHEKGRNGLTALFWAHAAGADQARQVLEDQGATLSQHENRGLHALRCVARNLIFVCIS
jgi:ankyrin repeat protein